MFEYLLCLGVNKALETVFFDKMGLSEKFLMFYNADFNSTFLLITVSYVFS